MVTLPDIIILWFIQQGTPDLSHATFETLGTGVCVIEKMMENAQVKRCDQTHPRKQPAYANA